MSAATTITRASVTSRGSRESPARAGEGRPRDQLAGSPPLQPAGSRRPKTSADPGVCSAWNLNFISTCICIYLVFLWQGQMPSTLSGLLAPLPVGVAPRVWGHLRKNSSWRRPWPALATAFTRTSHCVQDPRSPVIRWDPEPLLPPLPRSVRVSRPNKGPASGTVTTNHSDTVRVAGSRAHGT